MNIFNDSDSTFSKLCAKLNVPLAKNPRVYEPSEFKIGPKKFAKK